MSTGHPTAVLHKADPTARIGIAAARFNAAIVDALLADCRARLDELGVAGNRVKVVRVPGAFELPLAAKALAAADCDAVICLGAVIRGDTPHFDYVCEVAASGIARASLDSGKPVIFGVLTVNSAEQAHERTFGPHSRGGISSADAAVEMLAVLRAIRG